MLLGDRELHHIEHRYADAAATGLPPGTTTRYQQTTPHLPSPASTAPAGPTMAPWPPSLMQSFHPPPHADPASEAAFHAPYNKLLSTLFPVDTPFTVAPRLYRTADAFAPANTSLEYTVLFGERPVFVLQVKAPARLGVISARAAADAQLRERVRDLVGGAALPVLHAVSAFGTRLCFYSAREGRPIDPPAVAPDPDLLAEAAPLDRWDCDLLDDDGAIRLKEVVNKIRNQCENL